MTTIFKDLRDTDFSGMRRIASACYQTAKEKGWWEKVPRHGDHLPAYVSMKLMLIVSEAAEGLEEVRDGGDALQFLQEVRYREEDGKPEGFASELADVVIRCFDLAGWLKIDLATVIQRKMAHNEKRPYRHGGRKA